MSACVSIGPLRRLGSPVSTSLVQSSCACSFSRPDVAPSTSKLASSSESPAFARAKRVAGGGWRGRVEGTVRVRVVRRRRRKGLAISRTPTVGTKGVDGVCKRHEVAGALGHLLGVDEQVSVGPERAGPPVVGVGVNWVWSPCMSISLPLPLIHTSLPGRWRRGCRASRSDGWARGLCR